MKLSLNTLYKPHTTTYYSSSKLHVNFTPHCSSTLNNLPRHTFNYPHPQFHSHASNISHGHRYFNRIRTNYSTKLSDKWMEYQGMNDWAGLLDPLDDNLRSEIIRYGHFVEAAYRAFEFDTTSSSYGSCKFSKKHFFYQVGLSIIRGYHLTCHLRANSSIKLPKWAQSSWIARQSSWIGYMAVCRDKREIARLGRRDVVIAFRGTATCLEWIENLRVTLAPVAGPSLGSNVGPPMVETGFLSLYTSKAGSYPSLQEVIRRQVGRIMEMYPNEPLSFTFTGHSLGAALATLAAHDVKMTMKRDCTVTVMSYGAPRIGNYSFRSLVEKQGTKILRMVNPDDVITKVPRFVIENENKINNNNIPKKLLEKQINTEKSKLGIWSNWIGLRQELTQWAYVEVGSELKLPNQNQKRRALEHVNEIIDFVTSHDLKTYLKLVKKCSSRCPLRVGARKLLHKNVVASSEQHDNELNQMFPATS